jgi:hypothetical protein
MKKTYLAGLLLAASSAFAQVGVQPDLIRMDGEFAQASQRAAKVSAYDDTVWFNSFDTAADWTMTSAGGLSTEGWQISNATGSNTGTWYFQNGRISSTTGGNYAVIVPSDPNAPTFNQATMVNSSAIDISSYTGQLVLSYEKYGARFIDTLRIEVSNDNMNWIQLDDNSDFPINSTQTSYILPNPTSDDLFIPSSIVNGDSLFVRFNWDANTGQPGIGYGFFVDDVLIADVAGNDLQIEQTAFFQDVRLLYSWYFGAMPERQAAADTLSFSATYINRGKNVAPNSHLELVVSGQDSETLISPKSNTPVGQLGDTARTADYVMDQGKGRYTFTWNILSDSTDNIPDNSTRSVNLDVTDNVYSMAPYPVSAGGAFGKGGTATSEYVLTQDYYIMTTDTINGIGIAFDSEWSRPGASFQLSLIDVNDVAVAETDYYTSSEEMILDSVIYFPTVSQAAIAPGTYSVRFELFSNDSLFPVACVDPASPIEPAPSGGFYTRTSLAFGGSSYIEDMVYITLKNNDNVVCDASATVTGTVEDQDTPGYLGAISIDDVTKMEGPIFTYSWTGPNGFTSGDRDIASLTAQGVYSVEITDVNRCKTTKDFTVGGNVGVNDINFEGDVTLFPNPNNGNFQLSLDGVEAGAYTMTVKNVLGQSLLVKNINIASSHTENVEVSNLSKGIYFVEVENNAGNKTVVSFIVE